MVSTHLKNISQNGNLPQIGVKIKNVWNHHLEIETNYLLKENITVYTCVCVFRSLEVTQAPGQRWQPKQGTNLGEACT